MKIENNRTSNGGIYRRYIKRPMDFILSLLAIIIFFPLFLVVAVLVRVKMGTPVIFKQKRPGIDEKHFTLYKFRTMTDKRDENGELVSAEERLTSFGNLLRSTSLDELPELFNILKGDMAFVGPRPLLIEYLSLYNSQQRRRHEVRPGLSGLAQVNGRNKISWEEKFSLDIQYLDTISFIGDLKIILLTLKQVLVKDGINKSGEEMMERFEGTNNKEESDIIN